MDPTVNESLREVGTQIDVYSLPRIIHSEIRIRCTHYALETMTVSGPLAGSHAFFNT
jgi:hypothetical protein